MKQCTKNVLGEVIKHVITLGIPAIVRAIRKRRAARKAREAAEK